MNHKKRFIKTIFTALIGCLLFAAVILQPVVCHAEDGKPPFTITVEEEIPAQEIEESPVPLAAFSQEDTSHTVIIVCVLIAAVCSAAYLIYFARLKKRLNALRAEAAGEEQRWVETYRKACCGIHGED